MGNAAVAEELPGADELYRLDASEPEPEPDTDEDDTDEDDTGEDHEEFKPEGIPHG